MQKITGMIVIVTTLVLASASSNATTDSISYTYYPTGRLHTVAYPNGTTITYLYDTAGNRQTVTTTCSANPC